MPGFDDTRMHNDASSIGSLSFVSRMRTCASFLALFLQRSPPTAFNRSSLEAVCDLLLKADLEGPALIDCTARPRLG